MNSPSTESETGVTALLNKLCVYFARNDTELAANLLKGVLSFLTSGPFMRSVDLNVEEIAVERIRNYLFHIQGSTGVQKFDSLFAALQKSTVLKRKTAILIFLHSLGTGSGLYNDPIRLSILPDLGALSEQSCVSSSQSQTQVSGASSQENVKKIYSGSLKKKPSVRSCTGCSQINTSTARFWTTPSDSEIRSTGGSSRTTITYTVTEAELIQDAIYALQGVDGRYLRKETDGFGYTLDPKNCRGIDPIHRSLVERVADIGYLHNRLRYHCENTDKEAGTVAQALASVIREELGDYCRIIALLQSHARKHDSMGSEETELTLRRIFSSWLSEHHSRFQWLGYIAEECANKKGGALISAAHKFLYHGAKCPQTVAVKVLNAVCRPLYHMLSRWLLDGELADPYGEFFIEVRNVHAAERLWHDKYRVRESMIPSFISMREAKKILATGKSINFLRQVCKEGDQLPGRGSFQKLFSTTTADVLFDPEKNIEFQSTLDSVYKETSLRVLILLKERFRLLEHLQALRKYLLLGQGDFMRHLLELLVPELNKPASLLLTHTLNAILDSAIRVTNAQYEDEDTLKRLCVSLMSHSKGDTGWDVFSLGYLVDGPVGTIFQPTMSTYKCLFVALWKAKRMEYVLSNMRKEQIFSAKLLRNIKEVQPITHMIHMLSREMIHFLHQTQYYFLFEVLECSWAEMVGQVGQAECLDDIISAHNNFLNSVKCGVLLDESSTNLCSQLRTLYNLILSLESIQESLYSAALRERNSLLEYQQKIDKKSDGFGVTLQEEKQLKERTVKFNHFLYSIKEQVKQMSKQYNDFIRKYLNLLASNPNMNLQLLSVRLNFNDFYQIA